MKHLLLVFLLFASLPVFACSCGAARPFLETVVHWFPEDTTADHSANVVRATLTRLHMPYEQFPLADFAVSETVVGSFAGANVSLLGQDGGNCNGNLGELVVGQEYYLFFNATTFNSYGQPQDVVTDFPVYDFGVCGVSHLAISGAAVTGTIAWETTALEESEFLMRLRQSIAAGRVIVSQDTPLSPDQRPRVFPNPAADLVTVAFPASVRIVSATVREASGRLLFARRPRAGSTRMDISVSHLPAGVYYLTLQTSGGRSTERLVVR